MQLIKTCLQNTSRTYRLISSLVLKKLFILRLMKKEPLCFAKHSVPVRYFKLVKQKNHTHTAMLTAICSMSLSIWSVLKYLIVHISSDKEMMLTA